MTDAELIRFLAVIGEGVIWTFVIIVVFLFIVTTRADKE